MRENYLQLLFAVYKYILFYLFIFLFHYPRVLGLVYILSEFPIRERVQLQTNFKTFLHLLGLFYLYNKWMSKS